MGDTENERKRLYFNSKFISHSTSDPDIHGITVTDKGKILLCDVNNRRVLKYNSSGQRESCCNLELYPRDIALIQGDNQAVITLQESRFSTKPGFIGFLDVESMKLVKETRIDSTPYGIACTKSKIVVGSWNLIEVFDFDGALVKSIGLPEDKVAVKYLKIDNRGNLLYVTSAVNCITMEGNMIFNVQMESGTPEGLCIDDKCIYVSASDGQLLRMTENGESDDILLSGREGYGPLNAMCLNKEHTKMYISTNDGTSLSYFDFK